MRKLPERRKNTRELSEVNVGKRTGELMSLLRASEDPNEWANISAELTPMLIAFWDVHPHNAMQILEQVVRNLSVGLAESLVREVVLAWQSHSSVKLYWLGGTSLTTIPMQEVVRTIAIYQHLFYRTTLTLQSTRG